MKSRERGSAALLLLGFVLFLPECGYFITTKVKDIQFNRQVTGRLKRAADANTVEIAKQELDAVVKHLEAEELTSGYTSVLYRTPDEDVGFWYNNLKSSLKELEEVKPDATQLEKTNVLMKLRETLLDEGRSVYVTRPEGISVFPNNTGYAVWSCLGFGLFLVGLFTIFATSK